MDNTLRKIDYGGFEASLVSYAHDSERNRPVWVFFTGTKNAVKALLSRAKDKDHQGNGGDGDSKFAFHLHGDNGRHAFRLPDEDYKTFSRDLEVSPKVAHLPKRKRPTLYEGRVVTNSAIGNLPSDAECYVPVWREIDIPNVPNTAGLDADAQWAQYLEYAERPNAAKFKGYTPPLWCVDLYNIYMYLSNRVRIPMTPLWMPWLFKQVANRTTWGERGTASVVLVKFIKAYVAPTVLEKEKESGRHIIEHGVYRVVCNDAKETWRRVIASNPDRLKGLTFERVADLGDPKPKPSGGIDELTDPDRFNDGTDGDDWL